MASVPPCFLWTGFARGGLVPGYTQGENVQLKHTQGKSRVNFISHAFVKEIYLMYTARNTRGCASSNEARALSMRR